MLSFVPFSGAPLSALGEAQTQTLAPDLFTSQQVFFAPSVTQEGPSQSLTTELLTNNQQFYPATVAPGVVNLSPSKFENISSFYGAEVVQENKVSTFHEVDIIDFEPKLWWLRKPKAIPETEAKEKVKRVAGVIREVVKSTKNPTEQKREVKQAIAPLIREMPAFDWVSLMRSIQIQVNLEKQAEQERVNRLALAEMDEEDALILLMA